MKLVNFKIAKDSIALESGGNYFDLHNNYDLVSFEYRVEKRQFFISWKRNDGEWVDKSLPLKLKLSFINTSFLKIQENETDEFIKDNSCLDTIGFVEINMRDDMETWYSTNEDAKSDMLLVFLNGQTIKINSETVELELSND